MVRYTYCTGLTGYTCFYNGPCVLYDWLKIKFKYKSKSDSTETGIKSNDICLQPGDINE